MSTHHLEARKIARLAEEKLNNFFGHLLAGTRYEGNKAEAIIGRFQHGDFTYTAHIVVKREESKSCPTGSKTS